MPRPKYIAELHEAQYERLVCAKPERADKSAKYQAALTFAARIAGVRERELELALERDFRVWMKQEGLPKPSRK